MSIIVSIDVVLVVVMDLNFICKFSCVGTKADLLLTFLEVGE